MKKFLIALVVVSLAAPVMARSDNAKGASAGGRGNTSQNVNPNTDRNCYYCWKDLGTQYTPSRHKYGKTQ